MVGAHRGRTIVMFDAGLEAALLADERIVLQPHPDLEP